MLLKKIILWPNKFLRIKSKKILKIDKSIKILIFHMIKSMNYSKGIGISAVQIGVLKRIFILDFKLINHKINNNLFQNIEIFINPKILIKKGIQESHEGCLSIPNKVGLIKRHNYIKMQYTNIWGVENRIMESNGYLSKCIQHEFDHLEGRLWIDYLF
jgi:peptide deformylase